MMYEEYKWWEDKKRKPVIYNKSEMAAFFEVSLKTIDDWVRKGAPVLSKGSNGVSYEIDVTPFWEWVEAHRSGISIQEVRRRREAFNKEIYEKSGRKRSKPKTANSLAR